MNTKPFLVLLLAVGVIWGCETAHPLISEAETYLAVMQYDNALESIEELLSQDSTNVQGHFYKGLALGSKALEVEPPSDRKDLYREMRTSFDNAKRFGEQEESRPNILDEMDEYILEFWANEHNMGAETLTDDSLRQATENPEETAAAHFENATIVQPDSAISFVVLSSLQYQLGDVEQATSTYEHAMSLMSVPEFEDYEFLISLYFVQNRYEDVRDLTLQALEHYPGDESLVQFLADSYLETGETEEAINLIRELIQDDPDNPQYYFVLGTQLFSNAQDLLDDATSTFQRVYNMEEQLEQLSEAERSDLQSEIDQLRVEAEELESQAIEISNLAVEEIKRAIELNPDDDNAYNVLGIIYQNRAAALFDKRNNTLDNERAMQYDEDARQNLTSSMEYYEQAAELNPDESDYWQALFQVYTTLGMDEQAEDAMQRADME